MQTGTQVSPRDSIDRRRLMGGLAAGCVLTPGAAAAHGGHGAGGLPRPTSGQTVPGVPFPEAAEQRPSEPLSVNLLTRMGAAVRVNGHRALFVLDTGAERSAIARDLAQALALPPAPAVRVHGVTSAVMAETAVIASLIFGGQSFEDLRAPVFDRAAMGADGLIGLDVLSRFRLSLNLSRQTVTVRPSTGGFWTTGSATRLFRGSRTRAERSDQLILRTVVADGMPVDAFVDSGAQYSIGNLALMAALSRSVTPDSIPVYGVTGQMQRARIGQVSDLRIDGRALGPTPLLFADLYAFDALGLSERPALLMGADILYRFRRVTVDYARRRVSFGSLRPRFTPPPVTG